jgi:hypothetical protein
MSYLDRISKVAHADVEGLLEKERAYRGSWKKRGGVGAYMMAARKFDRIENQISDHGFDIFKAIASINGPDGLIDDIRDLRRYLMLIEAEMLERGAIKP